MPKKTKMENEIYDYILTYFKNRYKDNLANKITRKKADIKKYPTKESIVNLVLENTRFHESNNGDQQELGQISISRGTIRKAINRLCDENKINITNGSYEYDPHMERSLERHPILDIAPHINVCIGVPEDMIVLSVPPEFSSSIANYLSSLFHKGDILFIPISGNILCISVFPESVLDGSCSVNTSKSVSLRERIHVALHRFKIDYPEFLYGQNYEYAYHVSHNPEIVEQIASDAKKMEHKLPYRSNTSIFKSIQEAAFFLSEHPFVEKQEHGLEPDSDNEEAVGFPSQNEWDIMDSSIMSDVDDELGEYS